MFMLQYACTGTSWIEVSYDVFTSYQCGFFPNTAVTCWLEAVNEAGNSSQLSKSVITDCDGRLTQSKVASADQGSVSLKLFITYF